MPWSGLEIEHLAGDTEERDDPNSVSGEVDSDEVMGDEGGDGEGQPSAKRRRIGDAPGVDGSVDEGGGRVEDGEESGENGENRENGRAPYFKSVLAELDDKGENDCFIEGCVTRAGGNQYFVRHLMDKHGLVRGDQGRQEGGKWKRPKYLTLCPTNWPYNHGNSSSCRSCCDLTSMLATVGEPGHESPAICSFCWSYFPTRLELAGHINEKTCKSNEMFAQKLWLVRQMYAEALRIPGAEDISKTAVQERQEHAQAERAVRAEKWVIEAQLQQKGQENLRRFRAQQVQQQAREHAQQQAQQAQQHHTSPPPPPHPHPHPPHQPQPQPIPANQPPYSTQRFTPTLTNTNHPHPHPPPPPPPHNHQHAPPTTATYHPMPATTFPPTTTTTPTTPIPPTPIPPTPIPPAVVAAATDSLARSVERLSAIIADLTATNTQLLSDLRARDAQLAGRDQQVRARDERILALSGEVKRLSLSLERERERERGRVDA